MLSELFSYISQDPQPDDTGSVKATLHYLEACNKIFEKGLLSHDKVIRSIKQGFSYFAEWHASLSKDGEYLWTVCMHTSTGSICTI